MKSRRILLASIAIGASRPPNKYSKNFVSTGLNMSAPIIGPPNLAGNGSTGGGPSPPAGDDNSSDYNAHFNPSMAIIIVVLLSAFFFMAFFSIYIRRCTDEDDRERNSRRGGPLPNGNGRIDRTSQGLDRELIESFPIYSYSLVKGLKSGKESLECAVCLSEFEDDEQLRLLPKCSHTFHPDCIDMWLQSHTTCPVCRTSLVPGAGNGSNAAVGDGTDGSETGSGNGDQLVIVVQGSNTQGGEANACGSHDSPIFGLINSVGARARQKIRRSNSTGHSLVRAPSACNSKADRLVGLGQTSGIHRSSSCVNFSRNSQDSHGSSNCAGPSCSSRRSESGRVLGNETGNIDPRIIASERWSLSMNPSSFLRTFSERAPPHFRDQLSSCRSQAVKQDGNAYMQSLRRSIKWLTRRDPSAGSSRSSKNEMPTP